MHVETQEYLNVIQGAVTLVDADEAAVAMQRAATTCAAGLVLQLAELQQAVMSEENPALAPKLSNALQRTQYVRDRLERLTAVLQELRTGLKDLRNDQTALLEVAPAPAPEGTP